MASTRVGNYQTHRRGVIIKSTRSLTKINVAIKYSTINVRFTLSNILVLQQL